MDDAATHKSQLSFSTVLVVDDEPLVRAVVCENLRDFGWRALEAHDAREAIQILEGKELVHLVFSDIQMPGMDGFELMRWIREHRPGLRVLLASGVESVKTAGGYLGTPRWLVFKPYSMTEVDARLREMLAEPNGKPSQS
jgi:CheY-like chemotaxis protein